MIAAQVTSRIESVVMFGAALLILAPDAETALNRLQQDWVLALLGCTRSSQVRGALAVVQCGWCTRLGSRMLESAITMLARIRVLPADHPAAKLCIQALATPAVTWVSQVKQLMRRLPGDQIPDITAVSSFSNDCLSEARKCPVLRKQVVRRYRLEFVHPVIVEYDRIAFQSEASYNFDSFGWCFKDVQSCPGPFPGDLFAEDAAPVLLRWFRLWAVVRISGKWPLHVLGAPAAVPSLDYCHECGTPDIGVDHPLCACPAATADISAGGATPSEGEQNFLLALFDDVPQWGEMSQHIRFVGKRIDCAMRGFLNLSTTQFCSADDAELSLLQEIDAMIEASAA